MNDLEIIKKHISKPVPFMLKCDDGSEDIINLKPISVAQQTQLFLIHKKFKKLGLGEEGDTEEKMMNVDDEGMKEATTEAFDFFVELLIKSMPNITKDLAEDFVSSNFDNLMEFVPNLIPKTKSQSKIDLIRQAQEEQKNAQEAKKY